MTNRRYQVGVKFTDEGSDGFIVLDDKYTYWEAKTKALELKANPENSTDRFFVVDGEDTEEV